MWICERCVKCTGCTPQLISNNRITINFATLTEACGKVSTISIKTGSRSFNRSFSLSNVITADHQNCHFLTNRGQFLWTFNDISPYISLSDTLPIHFCKSLTYIDNYHALWFLFIPLECHLHDIFLVIHGLLKGH